MPNVVIRHFMPDDARRMMRLQEKCLRVCPDMSLLEAGFYYAPGFDNGKNILCGVSQDNQLCGYVVVYPTYVSSKLAARVLWMDLRVDPDFEGADCLKETLLEKAIAHARVIQEDVSEQRAVLSATYFAQGKASIDYLLSRGFVHYESCYQMRRGLSTPIPDVPSPEGVAVRSWRMETEAEQIEYYKAYNRAFQNQGRDLDELRHFMKSERWSAGTTFTAYIDQEIVGSVMVYYDPDDQRNEEKIGFTEHVFVLPSWRRRGIAKYLLREGLRYLKMRGLAEAELEVVSDNRRALAVYESLGYRVLQEELSLGFRLA